jgi:hypothetical protein
MHKPPTLPRGHPKLRSWNYALRTNYYAVRTSERASKTTHYALTTTHFLAGIQNYTLRTNAPTISHKIIFFLLEKHIKSGHASVTSSDILLQVHLFFIGKCLVRVDLLLKYP